MSDVELFETENCITCTECKQCRGSVKIRENNKMVKMKKKLEEDVCDLKFDGFDVCNLLSDWLIVTLSFLTASAVSVARERSFFPLRQ